MVFIILYQFNSFSSFPHRPINSGAFSEIFRKIRFAGLNRSFKKQFPCKQPAVRFPHPLFPALFFRFTLLYHLVDPQNGAYAPRLRNGTPRTVRRISVVNLIDRSDSADTDIFFEIFQNILRFVQELLPVHIEAGLHIVFQQPGPYGSLMVCAVAGRLISAVVPFVKGIARRKRPQPLGRQQVTT